MDGTKADMKVPEIMNQLLHLQQTLWFWNRFGLNLNIAYITYEILKKHFTTKIFGKAQLTTELTAIYIEHIK